MYLKSHRSSILIYIFGAQINKVYSDFSCRSRLLCYIVEEYFYCIENLSDLNLTLESLYEGYWEVLDKYGC